jgi:DNA-binding SARP family transcriptional activator
MRQLKISLFGTARCAWDGAQSARLGRPGQRLLGYLVLHRNRPHSRERLAELLWGDGESDRERPRRRLNTALWRLRQSLAPPGCARTSWLTSTPEGEVDFAPAEGDGCWIDVEAFADPLRRILRSEPERAAERDAAELEAAVAHYGGDLLEGCYDEWVLPERRALQALLLAALEWLMRHRAAAARPEAAIQAGQHLLTHDPMREDIHRALMALYERIGNRRGALRQYDYCRDLLASELGVTPEAETEALHHRVLAGGRLAATAVPSDGERQLLTRLLEQVRAIEHLLEAALAAPPRPYAGWPAPAAVQRPVLPLPCRVHSRR